MNLCLTASGLEFYVDVALRNFDGRWLAVTDPSGDKEIGLGRSLRAALAACLSGSDPGPRRD